MLLLLFNYKILCSKSLVAFLSAVTIIFPIHEILKLEGQKKSTKIMEI